MGYIACFSPSDCKQRYQGCLCFFGSHYQLIFSGDDVRSCLLVFVQSRHDAFSSLALWSHSPRWDTTNFHDSQMSSSFHSLEK